MKPPQQAAVIPFRRRAHAAELCLIVKKASGKWGVPKGFIDPGHTGQEAALNEAWEEAGLTGRIVGDPLGTYEYHKWGSTLTVVVFAMEVLAEEDTWQEMKVRGRHWVSRRKAVTLLTEHPVLPLVERFAVARSD
jgi:8-oxo-dGTP pyrophosphatase MutT (NUDIX family)